MVSTVAPAAPDMEILVLLNTLILPTVSVGTFVMVLVLPAENNKVSLGPTVLRVGVQLDPVAQEALFAPFHV
jgi:hypothetical protein